MLLSAFLLARYGVLISHSTTYFLAWLSGRASNKYHVCSRKNLYPLSLQFLTSSLAFPPISARASYRFSAPCWPSISRTGSSQELQDCEEGDFDLKVLVLLDRRLKRHQGSVYPEGLCRSSSDCPRGSRPLNSVSMRIPSGKRGRRPVFRRHLHFASGLKGQHLGNEI